MTPSANRVDLKYRSGEPKAGENKTEDELGTYPIAYCRLKILKTFHRQSIKTYRDLSRRAVLEDSSRFQKDRGTLNSLPSRNERNEAREKKVGRQSSNNVSVLRAARIHTHIHTHTHTHTQVVRTLAVYSFHFTTPPSVSRRIDSVSDGFINFMC